MNTKQLTQLIITLPWLVLLSACGTMGGSSGTGTSSAEYWDINQLDNPESLLSTRTIYFDYDVSEIRADYRDVVLAHGQLLAANPSARISLEGHCDERGSREYNIGLGERRAYSVKRLLQSQGASDGQIKTISYGEERPAESGSNEAAWSKNRRVEFIYTKRR